MMEKISKETFEKWRKKHDWLLFKEASGPTGRQELYATPTGTLVAAVYSLDGKSVEFAPMVPIMQGQSPQLIKSFMDRR